MKPQSKILPFKNRKAPRDYNISLQGIGQANSKDANLTERDALRVLANIYGDLEKGYKVLNLIKTKGTFEETVMNPHLQQFHLTAKYTGAKHG